MVRGMPRPVLHRVRVAQHNLYWVGEYPLFLRENSKGWGINAAPSRAECKAWLKQHGLQGQYFRTRSESLEVLLFALQSEGAPSQDYLPRTTRKKDGSRQTTDGWQLRPSTGGWDVYDPQGEFQKNCRGSLWRALWLIDNIRPKADEDDSWPAYLTHDRTERGVHDGTDRSPKQRVE
jgi:hypothetical protein